MKHAGHCLQLTGLLLLLLLACEGPSTPMSGLGPTISAEVTPPSAVPSAPPTEVLLDLGPLETFRPALRPQFATDLQGMADATRYDLWLRLDVDALQIEGREVVAYTNREGLPLDAVYLRLFPNFPGCAGWMDVRTVRARGGAVAPRYEVERTALRVPLEPALEPGQRVTLELDFAVQIPRDEDCRYADFSYSDGVLALAHVYPQIPVYDDEGWNVELAPDYGDLVYADVSLYYVTATMPITMVVAASGAEVARTANEDETITVSWVAGPARDFYMALSPDYVAQTGQVGDIRVVSYFLPEHQQGGKLALKYVVQALTLYQERFGPYRYGEFEVAATSTTAGGIEYPGIVVLDSSLYESEGGFFQVAAAHEVAHQWWYNLVGNDQQDEPWVDEALATYSSILYFEAVEGQDAGQDLLNYYQGRHQELLDEGQDAPVNLPVSGYSEENYSRAVYAKGALFLDALRREVGDAAFWRILQRYYERFLYDIATGERFLEVAKAESGKDLTSLYRLWILGQSD